MSIRQDYSRLNSTIPVVYLASYHLESPFDIPSPLPPPPPPPSDSALSSSNPILGRTKRNWNILLASLSAFIVAFLVSRQAFPICFSTLRLFIIIIIISPPFPSGHPSRPVPHWSGSCIRGALLQARFPLFHSFLQPQPSSAGLDTPAQFLR